jgi:signal transduction histidine kinase
VRTREDPHQPRHVTDSTLAAERGRAEEELLERSMALGETADAVIQRARDRARRILELAREREDHAMDAANAEAPEKARIEDERELADAAMQAEYAEADAAVFDERSEQRRAIIHLLALERTETDRMLGAERRAADRLVAVRDDLLATVTHDLRNHLSAMLVRTSVMLVKHSQQTIVDGMRALQRSIATMDLLLTDLLDVASMESGPLRVKRVPTDLADVVVAELAVHRPTAEDRRVELTLDVRCAPIMLELDPAKVSRALMNLLTNALKFTPAGGRVEVVVERSATEACISVRDSGPGIAPDRLEAVFGKFSRIDGHTQGYGLGLFIARTIVEAQDGRIWAESELGQGSTFHICFPALG